MILVTGGCSFSEPISPWITTWPKHLENNLTVTSAHHTGLGCAGNGLISRSVIYKVTQLLKENNGKDILVGIMWSGPNRHEVFIDKEDITEPIIHGMTVPDGNGAVFNPYNFMDTQDNNVWLLLHPHNNDDSISRAYYKHLHNSEGSYINTLEHILRTQWFLQCNGIKYFMTTYTGEVLPEKLSTLDSTKHLYNQLDFQKFLPVQGEYEWCRDQSGLEFPIKNDQHPSTDQHLLFVEKVILPFLDRAQINQN